MMMMIRQQLVESLSTNDKQKPYASCKKPINLISMVDHEYGCISREESPISVISHSVIAVSQPSSACTSMEHQKSHLVQATKHGTRQYPILQEQGSILARRHSAASTSEDDISAAGVLPNGFFEASSSQEEFQNAPIPGPAKRMKSIANEEEASEQNYLRGDLNCEASQATHFSSSDDEDHLICFSVQGLEEKSCEVLQQNILKANGTSSGSYREKQRAPITLKQFGDRKGVQNLIRSTSNGPIIAPVQRKSDTNELTFNAQKSWDLVSTGALVGTFDSQPSRKPNLDKALIRTRSINPAKTMASSKWDDAEKWLCFDKERAHRSHTRMMNTCVSGQEGPRNHATSCKSVLPNSVKTKGSLVNHAGIAEGDHDCSSLGDKMEDCYAPHTKLNAMPLEANWMKGNGHMSVQRTIQQFEYLSSGDVRHGSQYRLSPAICASDGEMHLNSGQSYAKFASDHHEHDVGPGMKTPCISTPERKYFTHTNQAMSPNIAHHQLQQCGYLSSGEIVHQSHIPKAATSNTSDGENHLNYASDQPYKGNTKYTLRLKQHQILQKPRRSCATNIGGLSKSGNGCVGADVGRGTSHTTSRLSAQPSPHSLDQLRRQGSNGAVLMHGKTDEEAEGNDAVNPAMQMEFTVEKPKHGRSASMKDACTEVSPSISRRDIGTEMTPLASAPTSKCMSPAQNTSPVRHNTPTRTSSMSNHDAMKIVISSQDDDNIYSSARKHNLNLVELESCHMAKLELRDLPPGSQTSLENSDLGSVYDCSPMVCSEVEMNGSSGLSSHENRVYSGVTDGFTGLEARAAAWEEAERAKCSAKYKREEARINAWENLQKAKAEAELKKLEVRLEKLRARVTEKVMTKVAAAERRAEEMRAAAETQQAKQVRKVRERACSLRKHAHFPGSFAVCFAHSYMP